MFQCCFRSWSGRLSPSYTVDSGMAVQGHSKHLFSLSQNWYNQICSPALWQTCSWVTYTLMQKSRFKRQTQANKAAADCGQRSADWCNTLPAFSTPFPPLHSSKCTATFWCHQFRVKVMRRGWTMMSRLLASRVCVIFVKTGHSCVRKATCAFKQHVNILN